MQARDVMVAPVHTVKPSSLVKEAAQLLLQHRISAAPVVDEHGKLVGIITEGDLLHRSETGTERQRWLRAFLDSRVLAADYVKAHARKVGDVMTRKVVTASPETPLAEIATLLERNSIKRIPIVKDGRLVGIVSRANLVQAVASAPKGLEIRLSDTAIREKVLSHLRTQPWTSTGLLNVIVNDGVVDLYGIASSDTERQALRVAAESMPGVRAVNDHLMQRPLDS